MRTAGLEACTRRSRTSVSGLRSWSRLLDSTLALPPPSPPDAVLVFARRHRSSLRWTGRHYLRRCRAARTELRNRVLSSLASPPPSVDAPVLISDEETEGVGVPCHLCNKLLPCRRTLAVHLARRHGVDAAATQVAHGTRCEVCGVEFWATDRLRVHLRKNRGCLLVYDHGRATLKSTPTCASQCPSWQKAAQGNSPDLCNLSQRPDSLGCQELFERWAGRVQRLSL